MQAKLIAMFSWDAKCYTNRKKKSIGGQKEI